MRFVLRMRGLGGNPENEMDSYFLSVGEKISDAGGLPYVGGRNFNHPIIVFINENPIDILVGPSCVPINKYLKKGQNSIKIEGVENDLHTYIYHQELNQCQKLIKLNASPGSTVQGSFQARMRFDNPLFTTTPSMTGKTKEMEERIHEMIKAISGYLKVHQGIDAAGLLCTGESCFRRASGWPEAVIHNFNQNAAEIYSSDSWKLSDFDLADVELVWGKDLVLAYRKTDTRPVNLFEFSFKEDPILPMIGNLHFCYLNGELIVW